MTTKSYDEIMDEYERENAGTGWDTEVKTPGENDVVFTQFLHPNGRKRKDWIRVSPEVKKLATELISNGYAFECEILRTGQVHLDCCNDEHVLANAICNNDMGIIAVVNDLIQRAHAALQKWKNNPNEEQS